MTREVKVILWCDGPHGEEQVPALGGVTLTIDKAKPRTIDLCDDCYAALVSPVMEVLDKHGVVEPVQGSPAKSKVKGAGEGRGIRPIPGATMQCPKCEFASLSWNGLTQHTRLHHGIGTPELRELLPDLAPPVKPVGANQFTKKE